MQSLGHKISANSIKNLLTKEGKVLVFESIPSTSDFLKEKVALGDKSHFLAVALTQTKGRGRHGKSFYSPEGSGIYFSFALYPKVRFSGIAYLTVIAAVALRESIQEIFGITTGIKWVNDIYLNGKKCAGILAEASYNKHTISLESVVIGIGINLSIPKEGYPKEIQNIATALQVHEATDINKFIATVVNRFTNYFEDFESKIKEIVSKYKNYSIMKGKTVTIVGEDEIVECVDIDDECRLVVRHSNGVVEALNAGEVSLCLN